MQGHLEHDRATVPLRITFRLGEEPSARESLQERFESDVEHGAGHLARATRSSPQSGSRTRGT